MRMVLAGFLALALTLAACGDGNGAAPPAPAADTATTAPSFADARFVALSPGAARATATPVYHLTRERSGPAAAADTAAGDAAKAELESAAAGPFPLFLGISIHVEGFNDEASDAAVFARHRDVILQLAQQANDAGAVLTFELSRYFVAGTATHGDAVVEQLLALGQGVAVHADVGGQGNPTLAELRTELMQQRDALAALGVETSHVSGTCSRGPWVEASLAAGFRSTAGAVAFCMTSLAPENVPDGVDLSPCTTPAQCHGSLPLTLDERMHPFYADSSADFLSGTPTDGLLLIVGQSGESVNCLAEGRTGTDPCTAAPDDITAMLADLDEYLAAHDPVRVGALTYSWSIGTAPSATFAPALFAALSPYVADGRVVWASLPDIAARVRAEDVQTLPDRVISPVAGGWTLLANLGPAAPPATVLGSLQSQVDGVFTFNSASGRFAIYRPGQPLLSDLAQIDAGQAFWVHVDPARFDGDLFLWEQLASVQRQDVSLRRGFNLVAWTGSDGVALSVALAGLPVRRAYVWDAAAQGYDVWDTALPASLRTDVPLEYGMGLWLEVIAPATWVQR